MWNSLVKKVWEFLQAGGTLGSSSFRLFYLHLVLFGIPVGWALWGLVPREVKTLGYSPEMVLSVGKSMGDVVTTSAGVSLILTEVIVSPIMLGKTVRDWYLDNKRQDLAAAEEKGRASAKIEVIKIILNSNDLTDEQKTAIIGVLDPDKVLTVLHMRNLVESDTDQS